MAETLRDLVAGYLAHCRTRDPKFEEIAMRITGATFGSPPKVQWAIILEAVKQATDADLGHVAAGPLEGLLGLHGASWIETIENQAKSDPKFARAVTGVWKYLMKDDVWERVKLIKDLVPFDQWLPAGIAELKKRKTS